MDKFIPTGMAAKAAFIRYCVAQEIERLIQRENSDGDV